MRPIEIGVLLNDAGNYVEPELLSAAAEVGDADPDLINYAIRQCGFVFIRRVRRTIIVELDPVRVLPLAALKAFYTVKEEATAEGVVLSCPGNSWRRPVYELLSPREAALARIHEVARAAGKRAAIALKGRSNTSLRKDKPLIVSECPMSAQKATFQESVFVGEMVHTAAFENQFRE
jgi:hypothetical protein